MKKYSLCLLDLDGTLTDSKEGIVGSVKYALDFFGVTLPEGDFDKFLGPPLRESAMQFCGFDSADVEVFVEKYREHFTKTGIFQNRLYPGVIDMLEGVFACGIKMALATSKTTVYARQILEYFGIDRFFGFVAGSEMDGTRGRKDEVIAYALGQFDACAVKKPVMIGDRKHDIIGAQAHKIDSIGAAWGYGGVTELVEAGATKILHSPGEVLTEIINFGV